MPRYWARLDGFLMKTIEQPVNNFKPGDKVYICDLDVTSEFRLKGPMEVFSVTTTTYKDGVVHNTINGPCGEVYNQTMAWNDPKEALNKWLAGKGA